MKYIVCEKPGEFILKEKEAPVRKENEALLQINKVGIVEQIYMHIVEIRHFLPTQEF